MKIKVLEVGCPACKVLLERTKQAVKELGIKDEVVDVNDISEMMKYGVMSMPALVIDGIVKCEGKVPKLEDIKKMLQKERE